MSREYAPLCQDCNDPACLGTCSPPGSLFKLCATCRKTVQTAGDNSPCLYCQLRADLARAQAQLAAADRLREAVYDYLWKTHRASPEVEQARVAALSAAEAAFREVRRG